MRREDLEHLIRAAGAISGSRRIVIIGSQAILGQFPYEAPTRATLSMEADLLPLDAPDKADLLTGSIGELSPFHDTFGYFGRPETHRAADRSRFRFTQHLAVAGGASLRPLPHGNGSCQRASACSRVTVTRIGARRRGSLS